MKQLLLLGLVLLLAGCAAKRSAKAPAPVPQPRPAVNPTEMQAAESIRKSAAILQYLLQTPQNAVPDAILNRTHCIVVAPNPGDIGVASCRRSAEPDQWGPPAVFKISPPFKDVGPSDRLILVLSNRATDALTCSSLKLTVPFSVAAGLTVRQTPTVTDADLAHDAVTYRLRRGILMGAQVAATTVVFDQPLNDALYQRSVTPEVLMAASSVPIKGGKNFLTVTSSYFNAITPVGIIIHHTAIVPASHKVPKNEREVDEYHAQRGFAIVCFGHVYHVAYHYLIFPDGRIQPGRPERCEGAHARGYNGYLGISLVGDFSSEDNPDGHKGLRQPTHAQIRSLMLLLTRLRRHYRIPVQRILRHADISPTACPGDRLPYKQILAALERSR